MRFWVRLWIFLTVLTIVAAPLRAQSYPTGPITILVPYAAGGSADIVARLLGAALQSRLGKPVIVENRPGGSEMVATEALARSTPDGHTLAVLSNAIAINETLVPNRRYDLQNDIIAVARAIEIPFAMLVYPSVPASTIPELVAHAKSHPGQLNYGHLGPGSPHFFVMEWFKQKAGIDILAVPYRGAAPAYAALAAGEVQVVASGLGAATPLLDSGKARALGAISSKRPLSKPDLPTLAEAGFPEFDLTSWMGVFVRSGTPQAIVDLLQDELLKAIADPALADRLTRIGLEPTPQRASEFSPFVRASIGAWEKMVKSTGAKTE
jgi:tripartite-type tricarboxylate transporter receptor subunit TctC